MTPRRRPSEKQKLYLIAFLFPPLWPLGIAMAIGDLCEAIADAFRPLFAGRYKRYAAWPVVLWCRLRGHANQPTWDDDRCLRCGDRH